jgi:hypothetical protein
MRLYAGVADRSVDQSVNRPPFRYRALTGLAGCASARKARELAKSIRETGRYCEVRMAPFQAPMRTMFF